MSRDRDVRAVLDQPLGVSLPGVRCRAAGAPVAAAVSRTRAPEDVRDALTRQLDLPRGAERERVELGARSYSLRGSEVRALATIGAFRVVDARDLDPGKPSEPWNGDLRHLREQGLVEVSPHLLDGERTALVTLTRAGQALLERHRHPREDESPQQYYAGLAKPREYTHDAQLARVYAEAAERLQKQGAHVRRVVVDYEMKREYQRFLHGNSRGRHDALGTSGSLS